MSEPSKSALERHVQTGIAAVLVGLVGWIGISITGMAEGQARLEERVSSMQRDVDKMSEKIESGILPQARIELRALQEQIDTHSESFRTIWPRLREMKERIQHMEPKDSDRWQY